MHRAIFSLIGLLLIGYLFTGVATIRPEERAVVRRFGRIVARPGPGLWIGWPVGIDRIDRVFLQSVRRVQVGATPDDSSGRYLTGDQNLVNVTINLSYDIGNSDEELDAYVSQRDRAEAVLIRVADTALAEWVGSRGVDEVLLRGNSQLPGWLVPRIEALLVPYRLGLRVRSADVASLAPPEDVRPDFERVNRAQAGIRTQEEQARAEATRRLAFANTYRQEQTNSAQATANEQIALAQAEAMGFVARVRQYHQLRQSNPEILAVLWWDELGKLLLALRERGRIDLIDNRLGADGLDITQFVPKKK